MADGPKEFFDLFEAFINEQIGPSTGYNREDLENNCGPSGIFNPIFTKATQADDSEQMRSDPIPPTYEKKTTSTHVTLDGVPGQTFNIVVSIALYLKSRNAFSLSIYLY